MVGVVRHSTVTSFSLELLCEEERVRLNASTAELRLGLVGFHCSKEAEDNDDNNNNFTPQPQPSLATIHQHKVELRSLLQLLPNPSQGFIILLLVHFTSDDGAVTSEAAWL